MSLMDNVILLTTLSIMFGFNGLFVGANDVANAMGTSVGAKVLTIQQAIVLAGVFEVLGALLASDGVTNTLRKGLVHLEGLANADILVVYGMLSALAASATWLIFATAMGCSLTTHSIVGAILGYGWYVMEHKFKLACFN